MCAAEVSQADFEAMKNEIAELRKDNAKIRKASDDLAGKMSPIKGSVDKAVDAKYGPGAAAVTKTGKLTISGPVQIWYYTIQNDNKGLFEDDKFSDIHDTNADLVKPNHTDVFSTQVYTGGINYAIKGNSKIQLNYNNVVNPSGSNANQTRNFHDVRNDNFVVNFQVAF